jgi:hypothetical protein
MIYFFVIFIHIGNLLPLSEMISDTCSNPQWVLNQSKWNVMCKSLLNESSKWKQRWDETHCISSTYSG